MEIKEIEALARLMKENGLTSLAFKEGGVSLKLERRQEAAAFPQAEGSPFVPAPVEAPAPEQAPAQKEGTLVASPTVGVFTRRLPRRASPLWL